jgi:hypothetical protein
MEPYLLKYCKKLFFGVTLLKKMPDIHYASNFSRFLGEKNNWHIDTTFLEFSLYFAKLNKIKEFLQYHH